MLIYCVKLGFCDAAKSSFQNPLAGAGAFLQNMLIFCYIRTFLQNIRIFLRNMFVILDAKWVAMRRFGLKLGENEVRDLNNVVYWLFLLFRAIFNIFWVGSARISARIFTAFFRQTIVGFVIISEMLESDLRIWRRSVDWWRLRRCMVHAHAAVSGTLPNYTAPTLYRG